MQDLKEEKPDAVSENTTQESMVDDTVQDSHKEELNIPDWLK
jgi:hypothetical protein